MDKLDKSLNNFTQEEKPRFRMLQNDFAVLLCTTPVFHKVEMSLLDVKVFTRNSIWNRIFCIYFNLNIYSSYLHKMFTTKMWRFGQFTSHEHSVVTEKSTIMKFPQMRLHVSAYNICTDVKHVILMTSYESG